MEERARGIFFSTSMFEFQQLEYLYGNCTWESVSTWTPANARERMLFLAKRTSLAHSESRPLALAKRVGQEEREIRCLKKLDLDDDEEEGDEDEADLIKSYTGSPLQSSSRYSQSALAYLRHLRCINMQAIEASDVGVHFQPIHCPLKIHKIHILSVLVRSTVCSLSTQDKLLSIFENPPSTFVQRQRV